MAKKTFADRAEVVLDDSEKGFHVKIKRTEKEKLEVCKLICNLVATNKYTLESICKKHNVNYLVFLQWASPNFDLADALVHDKPLPKKMIPQVHSWYTAAQKMAQNVYVSDLKEKSRIGLMQKIEGVPYKETIIEEEIDDVEYLPDGEPNPSYGKMKIVKRKVKSGIHPPDTTAVIFALTNVDSDNFKNSKYQKIDTKVEHSLTGLENLSDQELIDKRREFESRLLRLDQGDKNAGIEEAELADDDEQEREVEYE